MDKLKLQINVFLFLIVISQSVIAQDRMSVIEDKLDVLRMDNKRLDEKIDISVSDLSIHEFLRGVAQSTKLNISVDNSLDFKVANSFQGVVVYDLLLFLCNQYNLDLNVQGSIIHFSKMNVPLVEEKVDNKGIVIDYSDTDHLITIDVINESLTDLCRSITKETGVNVLPDNEIRDQKVNGYVFQLAIDDAIKAFCESNALLAKKDKLNTWHVSKVDQEIKTVKSVFKGTSENIDFKSLSNDLQGYVKIEEKEEEPLITVSAYDAPIAGLIKYVSDSLSVNYAFVGKIEEKITIHMYSQSYDDFIEKLLKGTVYCCKKEGDVYYFTNENDHTFSVDKCVSLLNRPIGNIMSGIPEGLKENIEIVESPELNSLFLSGESSGVDRLERFIKSIDQVVPVVLIEVLIIDVSKTKTISTGINAGFGENPEPSKQTILPGIDYQLSTKVLNNIFRKFESFGSVNLGKVSPNFYLAIKALEENGFISVKSTPKLSTLNGSKASLSSGETKYYKEEQSNYYGSQNPALTSSYTWKPINADMSLNILPVVSGDDQVTLEIEVQQSEFTPREFEDSPPGSVTRNFKSSIRVKNQEMVLLGGLDRLSSQNTGKGIPILARIPILKWIFSTKTKSTSNSKLNVFIQPTILN